MCKGGGANGYGESLYGRREGLKGYRVWVNLVQIRLVENESFIRMRWDQKMWE